MRLRHSGTEPATSAGRLDVVVAGAHGGAGTTTLAVLLGAVWDMGAVLDADPAFPPVRSHGRPLLVVCRGTVPAARQATAALTALEAGGEKVTALVVVSDGAGSEPRDATARLGLLAGKAGAIVRVPFVPALRLVDDPLSVALPSRMRRALAELRDLTGAAP